MLTCQNCGNQWRWALSIFKVFTFTIKKKCPYCGQKQYFKTSAKTAWFVFAIPVVLIVLESLGVPNHYVNGIAFLVMIAGLLSIPFFGKLTNEKENNIFYKLQVNCRNRARLTNSCMPELGTDCRITAKTN